MEILGERILGEQKWTVLKEKTYRNESGREGRWTYIERRGRQKAVVMVALTEKSGELIVIEQYRVPFGQAVLEFPAGLVDPGEDLGDAARRELLEETGYQGRVEGIGPEVCTTSGLSTETIHLVYMRTSEDPVTAPAPEAAEAIKVLKIRPQDFAAFLRRSWRDKRMLDAKLFIYLKEVSA